jgi:predicted nucleotidyltransferase
MSCFSRLAGSTSLSISCPRSSTLMANEIPELSKNVDLTLQQIVEETKNCLGTELDSIILFGSGAEGRLRATSDVNLLLVLHQFTPERIAELRNLFRMAQAAIELRPMFLLKTELDTAKDAFAVKFSDILRRHKVLYANDPLLSLKISRESLVFRLRQVLLNELIRLRAIFVSQGSRAEQISFAIAEAAGPLRSAALSILELEGASADSPRDALEKLASRLDETKWAALLQAFPKVREKWVPPYEEAVKLLNDLISLTQRIKDHVKTLN